MKTGIKPTNKYTFNRTEYKKGKTFGTGALDFENLVNIFYNIYIITFFDDIEKNDFIITKNKKELRQIKSGAIKHW